MPPKDDRRPGRAPLGTPPLYKARSLSPGGPNRYGFTRNVTAAAAAESRDGGGLAYGDGGGGVIKSEDDEDNPPRTRTSPPPPPVASNEDRSKQAPSPPAGQHRAFSSGRTSPTPRPCASPPMMLEMSGSTSTASLSPVPSSSAASAPSALASGRRSVSPISSSLGRRSVSPRTTSPRGSNVSRIIAALETVIPTCNVPAAAASSTGHLSSKVPTSARELDDDEGNDSSHPVEIGSTPHPSTVLRTVEPKRAPYAAATSDGAASTEAFTRLDAVGGTVTPVSMMTTLTPMSSMSWRRPPPSPRAASKPRPVVEVDHRYSPAYSDSSVLETIDLPPQEEDGPYGSFMPVTGGIKAEMCSPPREVPDFGNISAISHDDASGESPVLIQVHRDRLEVKEVSSGSDAGPGGDQDEEERDVPTELVKTRSNKTVGTVLSDTFSDPSTTTEVTSNVTATAAGHPLAVPKSPRFSRSAVLAQRNKISSRRVSSSPGGKSKRSTPPASASSSPSSNDRRRTPRRGSSHPPKPSPALAGSPGGKPRARSTGRRRRYGSSENPTSDSDESIDSQASQEALDPDLVQYFLDLILAEEGIAVDDAMSDKNGAAEASLPNKDAAARSFANAIRDGPFGAKGSETSKSPTSVIVDFWKSFACDNLWQNNGKKEDEEGRSTAERSLGEDQSPFAAFDATFFQELWKELEAYRETCGSLRNVQDLRAYVTSSRSETPATMTTAATDISDLPPPPRMVPGYCAEARKSGRSDIMSFCVPKDKSIGSKDRSNMILQRCKQRYPMLYEKLVQRLEDERARRKLGLLRRYDVPSDSAFSTCTDEYTSGQECSAESVDTSDNANDTPRTTNKGTVTRPFQSVPVGFGVLRAPVAPDELPPRSAPSRHDKGAVADHYELNSESPSKKEGVSQADGDRRLPDSAGCAPLESTSPSVNVEDSLSNHQHPKPVHIERAGPSREASRVDAREEKTLGELGTSMQDQPLQVRETPASETEHTDCIAGSCNPLEPILETKEMTSLHPPDVVVRRCSSTDKNEDGFNDADSFGVHSNLTEEKKWSDVPDEKKLRRNPRQSRSIILTDLTEVLGADRFDLPCDDNDKSTASGKDILADLARMTDPGTLRDYSKVVRRSSRSRSRSGSRERSTLTANKSVNSPHNSPPTWEVFESGGFQAQITPKKLFPDDEKIEEQGVWEDFTARDNGTPVVWPTNEGDSTIIKKSEPLLEASNSSGQEPYNTSLETDNFLNRTLDSPLPSESHSKEEDRTGKSSSFVKGSQRFSLVNRIRSSSVSKSKTSATSSSPSPKKGWLRRRSKARTQISEFDQAEWRSFDASRLECDASLATLDDAPTAALLQSKGSPTSVVDNAQRLI